MKNFFFTSYKILSLKEIFFFTAIAILLIMSSIFEVIGVASFGPFLKVATNPSYITSNKYLLEFYNLFNFSNNENFVLFLGILSVCLLASSSILTMISGWIFINYTHYIGYHFSGRLFSYYLKQPWTFFLSNQKDLLFKKISNDVDRVIDGVFIPILFVISKLLMCLFIFLLLLFLNPKITFFLSASYIIFYFVFFIVIKKKISKNNLIINVQQKKKFQVINETIAGIKDIILANRKFSFYQKFFEANKIYHKKIARLISISLLPRGILELISIIIVTFVFITLLKSYNNDLSEIIPIISVYALAGLKMIPAIQVIFQNLSLVRGSMVEFNSIKNDLINSKTDFLEEGPSRELIFNNNIILDNISYNYLSRDLLVVNNFSLEIKKNTLVSIIGPNGSGKSTIIHIILGLLSPIKGKILVDNKEINTEQMLIAWQKKIGYVSQNIFLFNDTILNNIVFDIDSKNVNLEEVYKIIDFINLKEFIDSLPYGLNTKVGDNGIFLSGGQKQKIAIARCLIKNSEVIIFDEATSSLDPDSEKSINDLIFKLRNSKTIINVTHRIDSLVKSDLIYYIKEGQLVAKGNYEEVFSKIESIRKSKII